MSKLLRSECHRLDEELNRFHWRSTKQLRPLCSRSLTLLVGPSNMMTSKQRMVCITGTKPRNQEKPIILRQNDDESECSQLNYTLVSSLHGCANVHACYLFTLLTSCFFLAMSGSLFYFLLNSNKF